MFSRSNFRMIRLLGVAMALGAVPALALAPARTKENVQRKAVVITHDAELFDSSRGDAGSEARFMQVYFLLEGEAGGRSPVTFSPNKTEPDGWLAKASFTEWNTLQMINFEPQSGRELTKIFDNPACSENFGLTGESSACDELGSEPQRAGKHRDDYGLLIPVFQRDRDNYQGGFVRVTADGPAVAPQASSEVSTKPASGSSHLGYDLILVVDATASMEVWFKPTTEVLRTFIQSVKHQVGNREMDTPFNVGLLLYRDRKVVQDCDIGYLTRWEVDLSDDINAVASALERASEAKCGSDELAEAVYDALNRAVQDPKRKDGHFQVVLLIGDAPPHPASFQEKNPLGFTVDSITQMAGERNIRFLTFKIGTEDSAEFEALAFSGNEDQQGKFRAIEPNPSEYKRALLTALQEEWDLLTTANAVYGSGVGGQQLAADPALQKKFDIDAYELPIIIANLPPNSSGQAPEEFVEGWVPKKIKKKLAMGEYVFMGKSMAQRFANVIETISLAAQDGMTEGSDAFITSLRSSLATMLSVQPDELFRSGESMQSMMKKAAILPFKTTVLSFTADEINTWKPADFERLNKILSEKTEVLRSYIQKPGNLRLFGDKPHVYVPRDLFP